MIPLLQHKHFASCILHLRHILTGSISSNSNKELGSCNANLTCTFNYTSRGSLWLLSMPTLMVPDFHVAGSSGTDQIIAEDMVLTLGRSDACDFDYEVKSFTSCPRRIRWCFDLFKFYSFIFFLQLYIIWILNLDQRPRHMILKS